MTTGNYAAINGLKLYYEVYGTGQPLILLHGGLGLIGMFESILPALAQQRQIIGIELEGHGHTALLDRPLSFEQMADDIAVLIGQLNLANADLFGYSLGGGVALQMAIRHPELVRKLIVVSAPCKRQGWYPEVLTNMASMTAATAAAMIGSPMQRAYAHVAPRSDDWPTLVDRIGQLLRQEYDWSTQLAALKIPTQLVFGDADSVRASHIVEMFQLLGGGQQDAGWDGSGMSNARLAVLPATTHYNVFTSPLLTPSILPFLD